MVSHTLTGSSLQDFNHFVKYFMLCSYDNRGNAQSMTQVQSEIIKIFHLQPTDNKKFTNLNYSTNRLCKSEDSHQGQQQ